MSEPQHYAAIACGVLEWNLERAIARSVNRVDLVALPQGLHANPRELRRRVQSAIDELDGDDTLAGIILGYGLCGRGMVGVRAGRVPLAVPRCEDCTAIFLGSQRRYRAEFGRYPGTRYFSCGWTRARRGDQVATMRTRSLYNPEHRELVERFGEDNARFIIDFRNSWRRNYQRAAYVRFSDDPDYDVQVARVRALAEAEGWRFEELEGSERLFQDLVDGRWDDPAIIVVRPGERIVSAPGDELMGVGRDVDAAVRPALERFRQRTAAGAPERRGLGLGIDAGGTFTDSVLYDFAAGEVVSSAKAPTTHDDLVVGIAESIEGLDGARFGEVTRVALSTTLATNASVEGKGQPVGVLLMGIDEADLARLTFRHTRVIPGRMSIEGEEQEPTDEAATRRAVASLAAEGVQAVAISGHAAVISPAHELAVARIVWETAEQPVVCGHELTRALNLYRRAETAALNARLLPLIEDLIRAVRRVLGEKGLGGVPLMVVCGDGTQLLDRYAERFPVETLLSGPAASVIGALTLAGRDDALVADMGGTTLDVAIVRNGRPVLSRDGAEVGRFRTCVEAMRIHTVGLGGDSEVKLARWPHVDIGPRRVTPLSVLAARYPDLIAALRSLAARDLPGRGAESAQFLALGGRPAPADPTRQEAAVLAALGDAPAAAVDVAARVGLPGPQFLNLDRLERLGAVSRAGLTPTDLFHVEGLFNGFSTEAAVAAFDLCAAVIYVPADEMRAAVWLALRCGIVDRLVAAAFEDDGRWRPGDRSARFVVEQLFREDSESGFNLALAMPIVPIGAPVVAVFPELADPCGTQVVIPPHAPVANAVGAIAGDVLLAEHVEIAPATDGAFQVRSRLETVRVFAFDEALDRAEAIVRRGLAEKADQNGVPCDAPDFEVHERTVDTPLGPVFLGVTLTGRVRG